MPYKIMVLIITLSGLLLACSAEEAPLEPTAPPTLTAQQIEGEALFRENCASCHAVFGDRKIIGPSLAGIATLAATRIDGMDAETYLYQSIVEPDEYLVEGYAIGSMQQNFATEVTEQGITDIIAYLMTLG